MRVHDLLLATSYDSTAMCDSQVVCRDSCLIACWQRLNDCMKNFRGGLFAAPQHCQTYCIDLSIVDVLTSLAARHRHGENIFDWAFIRRIRQHTPDIEVYGESLEWVETYGHKGCLHRYQACFLFHCDAKLACQRILSFESRAHARARAFNLTIIFSSSGT